MIVLTAATGQIGSKVVDGLLGHDEPVRIIAHDPEKVPAQVRERFDVVRGSHRDRPVLDEALAGADTLFWLMPADRTAQSIYDAYVTASIPGAEAVVRHGIERVVVVSALGRGTGMYAGHVSASLAMEDLFRSTGVHVRALANPSFMENYLRQIPAIQNGVITDALPADLKLPMVATRDIAAVAVRLLLDHSWTGQDTVDLLGPEDLSLNDVAATLTDVLGTPIRVEPGDRTADKKMLIDFGVSEAVAQAFVDMSIAKEHGLDLAVRRTDENTTPTTFRQFAEEVLQPAMAASAG